MQGTGVRHKTRKLVKSVFVQLVHVQHVVPPVPGESVEVALIVGDVVTFGSTQVPIFTVELNSKVPK